MIKEAIGTGSTVDEAKAAAMLELGVSDFDDFTVEVLQTPAKKILGLFGGSPAKVKVSVERPDEKPERKERPNKKVEKKAPAKQENKKAEKKEKAESILTDKDQLILAYCRSGRRSKNAASTLATLGYTNIKEFGGIIDWKYDTITK